MAAVGKSRLNKTELSQAEFELSLSLSTKVYVNFQTTLIISNTIILILIP